MKGKTILAVVLGMHLVAASPVTAASAASVIVNGQTIPLQRETFLVEQRTYISAEDAERVLQADWKWDGNTGVLKIGDEHEITFRLDDGTVAVDGKWVENGQGAIVRGQQVYLPLRWIVEQAGHKISWNSQKKAVEIVAAYQEGEFALLTADKLTQQEKAFVESVKQTQGIHRQGNLFVIARGQTPNPGFGLQVTGTEWSWEKLTVYVKMTKPEPGKMYTQVIAYPHVMAKVDLPPYTTVVFLNADTKKPLFAP